MKRVLLLLAMVTCFSVVEACRYYCVIRGMDKPFSKNMTIILNFGKNSAFRVRPNIVVSDTEVADSEGKFSKIHTMVDAMNYLSELGWVFQQAYTNDLIVACR